MSESTSKDVAVVLAELLNLAEQLLLIKRFGIEAAKGLMTSLWASYDRTRGAGASEEDLTCKVISKACRIAENYFAELQKERQVYDVNQVRLFLCWALTAFPSECTVISDKLGGVLFIHQFLRNGKDNTGSELFQRFVCLIETVLSHSFDMGAVDSDRNEEFDALLDFIAWIERKRPAATLFVAGKIATLFSMPGHEMNEHCSYRTVIQRCSCLLHLGFEECARSLFKLELPQSGDMASQTDARQGYVHAQLLYREDYYREAQDIAKYALLQSEEDEEKREIEELLRHICAAIGIDHQEWLEGTHVHQTEKLAVKQNECQQRHVTQPRHRRPKCRQPTKLEPKASARMVEGKPVDTVKQKENAKQLPVSSPNTSWEQSISCTIPTVSKSSSTAGNRNSTRNTVFAEISLSDGLESEEDDIEDKGYDLETKCFNFTQHDFAQEEGVTGDTDWVGNVEETSLILPSGTADEEAQGWFQRSVQIGASAQQRYIHISPKQLKQYERPGKRESRYTDLEKDVPTLKALMASRPGKYKRCHLQIKSSHHAVAYVVGKHDSCTEIQIDGRSRIGRTFMDDEVVVEVLAEPKTRQDQNDIRYPMTQASVDKNTHGKVVGLLQTNRFSDVQHPELFCTLDDHETHLMWPLCKTVPKIHVLHDGVEKNFPREPNNYVEIFQITADGYLDHREFFKLNKSKMHQYVFRVVFITWRSNTSVYPLGAVFGVHFAGRDYAGGLELLAMQHRLPTLYPPDAVAQTDQLLQEENLPAEDRKDLRKKRIFTVDPKGARELDDAISIWREGVYFIVGVHITDVAAILPPGEGVDLEARRRGVTFYPHLRKPHSMLPEDLGEKRCSLLPGQERLAFSFFFKFNQKGTQIGDPEVERSLIKSVKQLTYADAQTILDGKPCNHISKEFHGDIHQLHRITSMLKENRQKHSKFFVPFEDPRLPDLEQIADHVQAHSLIEELMILTNTFVAKKLRSRFPNEMLLRCHQACSMEELTKWMEKEGSLCHLVMQLQGNHVTRETSLSVENSRNQARKQDITVMTNVWKRLCRLLEDGQMSEARRLAFTDGIHPLQHLTASHWMEMMKRAEYKCSHGLNGPDHRHFGLNQDVYTHFTSPMRRYADLHVQRLLHNDLDGKSAYCTTEEVTDLCRQLNSAKQRQAAFQKGCLALKVADDLQRQPLVFRTFVNAMDTEKMTVCIPSLIKIPDHKMEIPFSVLRICSQPDFSTDTALKQDSVCLVWSKRHFDNRGTCPSGDLIPMWKHIGRKSDSKVSSVDMTINPDQLTVPVNQKDWIGIVRALISKEINMCVPEQAKRSKAESMQVNYVSSEKGDGTVCLRPVRFKRVYKPGQVLQLQLSAEPHKGVLKLQVELVELARNASICTKHTRNPVQALTAPATRTTRDQQFTSSGEYLQAWMPLLEMEAAAGAGDTDSAVTIDFVKVSMTTDKIGYFCLSAKFCTERCISIGGKSPDSIRAEDTKQKVLFPLDYLCLRLRQECPAPMVSRIHQSLVREAVDSNFTWLAHACVLAVTRKGSQSEDGAHLKVNFILSPSSPKTPDQLMDKEGARVTVEILTKSEVERRAQEMLLQLEEDGCYLIRSIAYGSDIPELDEDHYKMAQKPDYHEVKMKSGPSNNKRQGEAIRQALASSLLLIQGPPGTGKTYTGIKLIYLFSQINWQLMAEGKGKKSILFCGPSNKSVDLVADLLKKELGDDCPKMVRVYSSAIEMKDFPVPRGDLRSRRVMQDLNSEPELKHISLHHLIRENGKMYADDITKLEKEFAKSLRNPDKFPVNNNQLKTYRTLLFKASVEELKHHDVILTTCAVAGSQRLIEGTRGRVFQVIIDECAMCSEPQAMIPLVAAQAKQVVLIGDHKQLRPVITCQAAADLGLDQSLFERLFERFQRNTVFLDKQYRMHPQLCNFPSYEFYDGKLQTGLSQSWTKEPLPFWCRNPDYEFAAGKVMEHRANMAMPHIFVDVKGSEETLTVTTDEGNERSKSNALEIDKVIEILRFLKERHNVQMRSVRVLTQYNAQRNEISKGITKKCEDRSQHVFNHSDKNLISVSTVVSSQGGEWDYVILSTVRSLPSYRIEPYPTQGWNRQNLGFITDHNQVNVALTRAKRGLFIVGNAELLSCDPLWKRLLDMYKNKRCVFSAEEFP